LTTGEQENSPSDSERPLQAKQKRPQRKVAASRKVIADQSEDEIDSDRYEEREDDAEPKPMKSRKKKTAENNSGIRATASKKSKKVSLTNASISVILQMVYYLPDLRPKPLRIPKSGLLNPYPEIWFILIILRPTKTSEKVSRTKLH
jgi:hypothetical protein